MQFIDGSHKEGFYEHVQSVKEGNVLNENQDMIVSEKWQKKIFQTQLLPGQCTFHDGEYFFLLHNSRMYVTKASTSSLGMLVHGSQATLTKRRMGLTAQFCQPSVKMVPMNYTKSIAFTEDFRKPVLICGRDNFGKLEYVKTTEDMLKHAIY